MIIPLKLIIFMYLKVEVPFNLMLIEFAGEIMVEIVVLSRYLTLKKRFKLFLKSVTIITLLSIRAKILK